MGRRDTPVITHIHNGDPGEKMGSMGTKTGWRRQAWAMKGHWSTTLGVPCSRHREERREA
jgi:hypothetical protein